MSDIIEGFMVGGSTEIRVSNQGCAVVLTAKHRVGTEVEVVFSADQSARLRRLLRAAERRAAP